MSYNRVNQSDGSLEKVAGLGIPGTTPVIAANATVDATSGTPSVTVTKTGTDANPSFTFNFRGLKGEPGEGDYTEMWKVQGELGAKNLIKYPYDNFGILVQDGITYAVNDDGSITLNGTATKTVYKLLIEKDFGVAPFSSQYNNPNSQYRATLVNGTPQVRCNYNPNDHYVTLLIENGTTVDNLTVYPMIRYKSDNDDTWQPYAPTNRDLNEHMNEVILSNSITNDGLKEIGAINALDYPYLTPTRTILGITFTDNKDGSITINGTAESNLYFNLSNQDFGAVSLNNPTSEYTLTDIVEYTQNLYVAYNPSNKITSLNIISGTVVDNVTFHPQVYRKGIRTNAYVISEYLPIASNTVKIKRVCEVGASTATFYVGAFLSKYNITSSDLDIDVSAETTSGNVVAYNNVSIGNNGVVTITFDELTEAATFVCKASKIQ